MKTTTKMPLECLRGYFKASVVIFLGLVLLATSCKKDNFEETQVDASALNVVNASPGPVAIHFFLNNLLVNGPALLYTERTGYFPAYAGITKFDATVGGTTQVLVTDTLELQKDKSYSLYFAGQNTSPVTVFTEDDLTDPPAGKAKIRFIHLSPDAPALDLAVKGGAALFTDRAFKTVSAFIPIDPATVTIELRAGESGVVTEITNVQLAAGRIYTIWAKGLLAGSGTTAFGGQVKINK